MVDMKAFEPCVFELDRSKDKEREDSCNTCGSGLSVHPMGHPSNQADKWEDVCTIE